MLEHISNGYVAKETLNSSLPKVKNDDQAAQQFNEGFNLSRSTMRFAGLFELIGSLFLLMSVFGKTFVRIGSIMITIILSVAVFKHFEAGHGLKGAKKALKLLGLNSINFLETLSSTNK
ncbi:hypothetical protein GCM10028778_06920 [Barrientosiimonas marina]|uniref:DoxX family protein n=1 Tax=Lentibacillus kimchii TaxID=1542911 RepID=A0ABW2UWV6_9BACI